MYLNSLFKHWSYRIFAPGVLLRARYEALKRLLQHDNSCHIQMAELQELLYTGTGEDLCSIRQRFAILVDHVYQMIESLEEMSPGSTGALKEYHRKFEFYCRFLLAEKEVDSTPPYLLSLDEITADDTRCGNKAIHLALLRGKGGLRIPDGMVITAQAFNYFIDYNNLRPTINTLLSSLDLGDEYSLYTTAEELSAIIKDAELPPPILQALIDAGKRLRVKGNAGELAVRSCALGEDGTFSFAGQYASQLNVAPAALVEAYTRVVASKYTASALSYRIKSGIGDEETPMAVLLQPMVAAKYSGIMYTEQIAPDHGKEPLLHIEVVSGLGDDLTAGAALTTTIFVPKKNVEKITSNEHYAPLDLDTIRDLITMAERTSHCFATPQDIEWAMDNQGNCYLLQARTLQLQDSEASSPHPPAIEDLPILPNCTVAATGSGSGTVLILRNGVLPAVIPPKTILVCRDTPPELITSVDRLEGVIASRGSQACHFATIAREAGIPYLCKVTGAETILTNGELITIDAHQGAVYRGRIASLLKPLKKRPKGYHKGLSQALSFVTPLELTSPAAANFSPEGCRSMHDIVRFCHEKAMHSMFTTQRPGSGRGAIKLVASIPLDVYLFDVGDGISTEYRKKSTIPLEAISSSPFQALWKGLSHPGVQWPQKPFDWEAYEKIELSGAVAPRQDSFAFASYGVVGGDYVHFNLRFGYHFTIVDALANEAEGDNHLMLRFAGGGGDFTHRALRIDFLATILGDLQFEVHRKGDLLEAKLQRLPLQELLEKLDMLGRLLGASKLMDMVIDDEIMVADCVARFHDGCYSFSERG